MDITRNNLECTASDDSPLLVEKNTLIWGFFLIGVVIGFVAVYIIVAQPMFGQLAHLQRQIKEVDESLKLLVGERNQAWEAGHLLSDLKAMKGQIRDARATLRDIRNLRKELIAEGQQTGAASEALAQLTQLQASALELQELTSSASRTLGEMAEIQQRLVDEHSGTPRAEETLKDLERVRHDLSELLTLKSQIAENAGDLAAAKATAGGLVSLTNDLIAGSQNLDAAKSAANRMFVMHDELRSHGDDLPDAFTSLDRLVEIKDKLVDQTPAIADAIQNLELLSDFRDALGAQISSLSQMRSGLLEIVLMESTLGRVTKLLEPLAQISNLRRLSDHELRSAARSILDSRSTRIGSNSDSPQIRREAANDPFAEPDERSARMNGIQRDGTAPPPVPLPITTESEGAELTR
ncbi:MAG: hypothetical protein HY290_21830 [Planctomycetia bacterium]|nr:hypothetical protein [Planctomycetia bacterium]